MPGRRLAAGGVDFAVALAIAGGTAIVVSLGGHVDVATVGGALRAAVLQTAVLLGPWVYLAIGWHRGATVGTSVMKLRVVDAGTMTLPTVGQCVRRAAGTALGLAALFAGVLWMAVDRRHRGWQDLLAGTVVIDRQPGAGAQAAQLPPRNPAEVAELTAPRRAWTWTDVVPVLVLFYPLAIGATLVISRGIHALHDGPITGSPRAVLGLFLDMVAYGINVGLVVLLVTVRRRRPVRELGLRLPDWRWLVVALPLGAGALLLSAILGGISQALFPNADQTQCKEISQSLSNLAVLTVIATAVIAPVAEEIVFRGFVLGWLQGRLPAGAAISVSAAIFAVAHFAYLQPTLFLPIFGIGLVLGGLYQLTRSVWPGVIVHGSLNLVATLVILARPGC
ncbi:MAG TPA: CPBP family glutamic-type intramembrane protease [Candidatus Dormibacteraeota bacterium]